MRMIFSPSLFVFHEHLNERRQVRHLLNAHAHKTTKRPEREEEREREGKERTRLKEDKGLYL